MTLLLFIVILVLAIVSTYLGVKLAHANTDNALLAHKLEEAERVTNNEQRFADVAQRIIVDASRTLTDRSEQRISQILEPLKADIAEFKHTFSDTYHAEARERFSLSERIRELVSLNQSLTQQAKELSQALRGNGKVQGDWGEMILETLLEKSGLKKGVHYSVQQTRNTDGNVLRNDSGAMLRPDVVINYPDDRCMVVDSKVSLTAYIGYVNSSSDEEAAIMGRQHLSSVRNHIKELATKNYQDYVGEKKADFVMMFIPNEGAYLTAMNLQPDLWQQAYDSRVIIISPTHLMSALRLVEQLWQQVDIQRNAAEIADEAGKMYDKLVGFVEDMSRIDKSIDSARVAYDEAIKKLTTGKGNLVKRASDMKRLGAKAQKNLPQPLVDASPDSTED